MQNGVFKNLISHSGLVETTPKEREDKHAGDGAKFKLARFNYENDAVLPSFPLRLSRQIHQQIVVVK